ncbi:MAG: hypothetical protein QM714_17620 [Nocardioides sp.]|uniref:hypothetical protein n=1 Tax=Nocardioides sp. TaxID=35761 RepID=UPI0039E324A9
MALFLLGVDDLLEGRLRRQSEQLLDAGEEFVVHQRLGQRHLVEGVVLHRPTKACGTARGDPCAVDVDVAVLEEDVDRAERVLFAEAQAAEAGDADLGAEQGEPGEQRVGAVGAAELFGGVGHRSHLSCLGTQAGVDVLRCRSVEDVGLADLQAVEGVDAAVEPVEPPGELAHRGELSAQVLAAALGEDRLRSLLHHETAVLDPPFRDGHAADGGQDVGVES